MTRPTRQLPLELALEPRFGREDFLLSPSNEAAWTLFDNWPNWPGRMLLLIGPQGSGKSHLAAIWAQRAGARTLAAAALALADIPALARAGAVLVEDADRLAGAEAAMFHLINLLRENGGYLALTAQSTPDHWGVRTADLLSRLRLAPSVEIASPDDALVRAVLVKLFIDRQLRVDTSLIEYLAVRIDRSLDAARRIVERIDREALASGRPVTRPLASDVLTRMQDEPGDEAPVVLP